MRLDSLYYFTEVAKDLHITRTAERLYMSQQTLSNHIARLEHYYGAQLLERKPKLTLTYAGELLLSFAEHVTRQNANLLDRIAEIRQEQRGRVRIAASALRVDSCLPSILAQYSREYPGVEVRVCNAATGRAVDLVVEDEADVAITLQVDDPRLVSRKVISDQVFLCVSHALLRERYGEEAERIRRDAEKGALLSDFSRLPFCILDNQLGASIRACFEEVGVEPIVHIVSPLIMTGTLVGIQGLAAFFSTRASLLNYPGFMPDDIDIFPLIHKGEPLRRDVFVTYRADKYLSGYLRRFIELIEEFFRITEATPVGPCARPDDRG